eukprot:19370-Chlamydomonas_euryale.AAC.7
MHLLDRLRNHPKVTSLPVVSILRAECLHSAASGKGQAWRGSLHDIISLICGACDDKQDWRYMQWELEHAMSSGTCKEKRNMQ